MLQEMPTYNILPKTNNMCFDSTHNFCNKHTYTHTHTHPQPHRFNHSFTHSLLLKDENTHYTKLQKLSPIDN